jgi:uncharacterized protein YqjF (DUF2071 family)
MREMLFINYAIAASRLRGRLPEEFEPDRPEGYSRELALISLVVFRVVGVGLNGRRLPLRQYSQLNCRVYVRAKGEPAVFFLAMRSSSLMATLGATALGIPMRLRRLNVVSQAAHVSQDKAPRNINSVGAPPFALRSRLEVTSSDLIGAFAVSDARGGESLFFTERPVGYISGRRGLIRVTASHDPFVAFAAKTESLDAPILREFGLIGEGELATAESVYYVPAATLQSSANRVSPHQ